MRMLLVDGPAAEVVAWWAWARSWRCSCSNRRALAPTRLAIPSGGLGAAVAVAGRLATVMVVAGEVVEVGAAVGVVGAGRRSADDEVVVSAVEGVGGGGLGRDVLPSAWRSVLGLTRNREGKSSGGASSGNTGQTTVI